MSSLTKMLKLPKSIISAWIIASMALCINFSPLLFNFLWGNHDWTPLIANNDIKSGLIEGRFSQYIFLNLLFDGNVLPILNISFGFIAYSLSLILLTVKIFNFSIKGLSKVIILISIITLPYIIEILYFQFICLTQLIWPLVITISIYYAKKATEENKIINTLVSSALLLLATGGYPASINMYITISCLLFMQNKNTHFKEIKSNIIKFCPYIISAVSSLILLKITYIYLQNNHLMLNLYNNSTIGISDLLYKIPHTIKIGILSLIQPQPFFSLIFKITTFTIFAIFSATYIFSQKTSKAKIIHTILILILLLSIKLSAFLTNETADNYFAQFDPIAFMVRTDFYSIPTLILFSAFYLNNQKNYLYKNIIFVFSLILLWINILANYNFSKTFILGFKAENLLTDRVTSRILSHPDFIHQKKYSLLQIGEFSLRHKYYIPDILEKYGYYTLNTPFTRYWTAQEYYNFYTPDVFVKNSNTLSINNIDKNFEEFISAKIKTWPNKDSIFINKSHIIVILTEEFKKTFQQQFNLLEQGSYQ